MQQRLQEFITRHKLFNAQDELIAAVSGGADSVAMLHLLNRMGYKVSVAHCNFNLRGTESKAEQDFVQELATILNAPFYTMDFNTELYAVKRGIGIQEAARELRYQWFAELHRIRNSSILTAHNLDDNLETVLINWGRGSGLKGLSGIPVRRDFLCRPLLGFSAEEIRLWCQSEKISYRVDSSNLKDDYLRNYLRQHVIPAWKDRVPHLLHSTESNTELIGGHLANYNYLLDASFSSKSALGEFGLTIPISWLELFPHPSLILYDLLNKYGFTQDVCVQMTARMHGEPGAVYRCGKYEVLRDRDHLLFYALPHAAELNVDRPGTHRFGEYEINITEVPSTGLRLGSEKHCAHFDLQAFTFPLTIRNCRDGDRMQPLGLNGSKLVSDIFNELRLPAIARRKVPCICMGDEILWIAGIRQSERTRVQQGSLMVWQLCARHVPES